MSQGRFYTVVADISGYTGGTTFFLWNSASTVFALRQVSFATDTSAGQGCKVQLVYYVTAAPTGGSSVTPNPILPGDVASSINAKTQPSAAGASSYGLWRDSFDSVQGYVWEPPNPDNPPVIGYSDGVAISIASVGGPSLRLLGTVVFEELF